MFSLAAEELQRAFEAIEHHGYSALLPSPPEWATMKDKWAEIKPELAALDLDTYVPTKPLRVYAPKSRSTVRVVSMLHPVDLLLYTALTLLVVSDLESIRIPTSKKRVFSYRWKRGLTNRLYVTNGSFLEFRKALDERSSRVGVKYVAAADIADFYPRIYQHRLENAVESSSTTPRGREVARVLVKKLIGHLSGNNSYGIPVGPYASRVLAEAVLSDIDSYLTSSKLDFVRWVDDYYFFAKSEAEAQRILISLAERLYDRHGLTLSALKTKIFARDKFRERFQEDADAEVDGRLERIAEFSSRFDPLPRRRGGTYGGGAGRVRRPQCGGNNRRCLRGP